MLNNFIFRLANRNDLEAILLIHRNNLIGNLMLSQIEKGFISVPYTRDEFKKIIKNKEIVVSIFEKKVVGYYLIGHNSKSKKLEYQYQIAKNLKINNISLETLKIAFGAQAIVDESYRGLGLTNIMLKLLIKNVKHKYDFFFSSITKFNQNAQIIHKHSGYNVVFENSDKKFVLLKIN